MKNNKTKIVIRPARKSDRKGIKVFLNTFPKREVLQKHFPDYQASFVAVDDKGRIVGHCGLDVSKSGLAEIRSLAVEKGLRRQGIASRLVSECLKLARKKKLWEIYAITGAEKFLETQGFKRLPKHLVYLFIGLQ